MSLYIDSEEEFNRYVNSGTVVVKWFARWCQPCKSLAPEYEKVASKHPKLTFLSVDADVLTSLADEHVIRTVPTLSMFRNGKLQASVSSLVQLESLLNKP